MDCDFVLPFKSVEYNVVVDMVILPIKNICFKFFKLDLALYLLVLLRGVIVEADGEPRFFEISIELPPILLWFEFPVSSKP